MVPEAPCRSSRSFRNPVSTPVTAEPAAWAAPRHTLAALSGGTIVALVAIRGADPNERDEEHGEA